jgi:hypothetical protein
MASYRIKKLHDGDNVRGYRAESADGSIAYEYHLDGTGMVRNKRDAMKAAFDAEVAQGDVTEDRLREMMSELDSRNASIAYVPSGDSALKLEIGKVCVMKRSG